MKYVVTVVGFSRIIQGFFLDFRQTYSVGEVVL